MRVGTQGQVLSQLREGLQKISRQQEELAEVRERVLIQREDMLASAGKVREQRERCAAAEARLMDAFREHHMHTDSSTPQVASDLYSTVETERNNLVELEDEHMRIAEDLDVSEWKMVDLERDLYQFDLQQLLPDEDGEGESGSPRMEDDNVVSGQDHKVLSSNTQYEMASGEYRRLTRCYNDLRKTYSESLEMDTVESYTTSIPQDGGYDYEQESDGLLESIMNCEVKLQRLRSEFSPNEDLTDWTPRAHSLSEKRYSPAREDDEEFFEAQSDGPLVNTASPMPTVQRVQDWLIHRLRSSTFEQSQYMAILRPLLSPQLTTTASFWYWENHIILYWLHDTTSYQTPWNQEPSICKENIVLPSVEVKSNVMDADKTSEGIEKMFDSSMNSKLQSPAASAARAKAHHLMPQITQFDHEERGTLQMASVQNKPTTSYYVALPLFHITSVNDHDEPDTLTKPVNECLGATGHLPPRCDSAQNSDQGSQRLESGEIINQVGTNESSMMKQKMHNRLLTTRIGSSP